MVARLVRDQEVVGSNPVTSTNKKRTAEMPSSFCCRENAIANPSCFSKQGAQVCIAKRYKPDEPNEKAYTTTNALNNRNRTYKHRCDRVIPSPRPTKKGRLKGCHFLLSGKRDSKSFLSLRHNFSVRIPRFLPCLFFCSVYAYSSAPLLRFAVSPCERYG